MIEGARSFAARHQCDTKTDKTKATGHVVCGMQKHLVLKAEVSTFGKTAKDKVLSETVFIREFDAQVDGDELVWHRDKKNREFAVLEGQDWWFQEDDKMESNYKR